MTDDKLKQIVLEEFNETLKEYTFRKTPEQKKQQVLKRIKDEMTRIEQKFMMLSQMADSVGETTLGMELKNSINGMDDAYHNMLRLYTPPASKKMTDW